MSNDIEYIEPTQEHVGQMVEVRQAEMNTYRTRKLLAVLPHPIKYRFVCQDSVDAVSSSHWMHARTPRPLTYAERQAKCGLKVGDRVKFVRAWEGNENSTTVSFVQSMQDSIGGVGYIKYMSQSSCGVELENHGFWFLPYFVLEKVEDRVATHKDYGKTVYVDGNPSDEFMIEIVYQVGSEPFRAVVRSGDKRFVYELNNLRVKE